MHHNSHSSSECRKPVLTAEESFNALKTCSDCNSPMPAPCGLFFEVQGPRMVRTHAVWAGEEGRILFYDTHGQRFAQTRLSEGPDPRKLR